MSTVGASNNASDIGLIVQGTLILLSAVVAVCGYYVQGRLKSKERINELEDERKEKAVQVRLETLRKKISVFVGPCVQLCLNIQTNFGYLQDWIKERYPDEYNRWRNEEDEKGFTIKRMWQGHWQKRYSIVGKYVENLVREKPESELSCIYRRIMKITINNYGVPLANLINLHGQYIGVTKRHGRKNFQEAHRMVLPEICFQHKW
jgi:hypothetical protein